YLEKASPLPDMIWLDYYLKNNMNGLDFLKKIHGNSKWSKIPVIVVSNTASESKVKEMLAMGAKKYFLKAESLLGDIIDYIQSSLKYA
ncbi:MAG: response regulator, partial [Candidatus Peregrinibacteria bacterium]